MKLLLSGGIFSNSSNSSLLHNIGMEQDARYLAPLMPGVMHQNLYYLMKRLLILFILLVASCSLNDYNTQLSNKRLEEGISHLKNENDKEALKSFLEAVRLDNNNAMAHFHLGDYYFNHFELDNGNIDLTKAHDELLKAIEINHKIKEAHIDLGYIYFMNKDYNEAVRYFKNAIQIDNSWSYSHMSLGRVYYKQGLLREAESELKIAIQQNPEDYISYYVLSLIYDRLGLHEKAKEYKRNFKDIAKKILNKKRIDSDTK